MGVICGVSRSGRVRRAIFLFAAFVFLMSMDAKMAFAQSGGREIEAVDWAYHVPLAFGCVVFVVVVDVFVYLKFVRRG